LSPRLESVGVPGAPLVRRAGLTLELIADPEGGLSVQSQIRLLDKAAIALKDDCLGFTLARDFDPSPCRHRRQINSGRHDRPNKASKLLFEHMQARP
jgi:Arabinose-binding domain of AraC transcription regulator, N-term